MATSKKFMALVLVALAVFAVGCSSDDPVTPPDNNIDTAPPAVPSDLSATFAGSQTTISWAPNTVDPDLAGYTVSRSNNGDTEILVEMALVNSFADPAPRAGTSTYHVSAVDLAGNHSAVASVTLTIERGHETRDLLH